MFYFQLSEKLWFPDPRDTHQEGIVAVGGDLGWERLVLAYRMGIFPWYSESRPIIWWSPNPRFVLFPDKLKLRRSLRKALNHCKFEFRYDTAFKHVISHCSKVPRAGQNGTWINRDMRNAFIDLHQRGIAHSVETWLDDKLVGGLYGIAMGPFFFGESMFHLASNASKAALVKLVELYSDAPFIDCQVHNDFFESMGACNIDRDDFLTILSNRIDEPNHWEQVQHWVKPNDA